MKIFLCRHGQTTGDIEDRFGGDYEDHLTEEGKKQAQSLALKLKDKGIEEIFVSSRIRAKETAEVLDSELKVGTTVLDEMRERNHYGVLTGMTKTEAKEKYPEDFEKVKDYRTNATGGEGYEEFVKRIRDSWEAVLNSGYKSVALVTHGGPIRVIFREILKLGEIKVGDCAFAEIEVSEGEAKVVEMDGVSRE